MDAETQQALRERDAQIETLRTEVRQLREQMDRYAANGLDKLAAGKLADQPQRYITAAPTDLAPDGVVRTAEIGGVRYLYGRAGGSWYRVAIA